MSEKIIDRPIEPAIYAHSRKGRRCHRPPAPDVPVRPLDELLPPELRRAKPPVLPEVDEPTLVRHYVRLSRLNHCIDVGFYPLGSCTMKYNPKLADAAAALPGVNALHPLAPEGMLQPALALMYEFEGYLSRITGMDRFTLQPAAGAHGEFTAIKMIRAYHKSRGNPRKVLLIPDSAHGTNPASGTMCSYDIVEVASDKRGNVSVDSLKEKLSEDVAALMLTNPNTLGIFDNKIAEISRIVHEAGGLMYYDGANLNAIMGKCRPGDMGFDVVHVNLHKTFATPHGGGGPGSGPVGVKSHLAEFLPMPTIEEKDGFFTLIYDKPKSIGKVHGYYGNVNVMLKAYAYMLTLGGAGLKEASELSVLNSNYVARRMKNIRGLSLPYSPEKPRMHEAVLSAAEMNEETGVRALNIAKKLIDYGLHAPTIYFPLIVHEALMIEPTETESVEALDDFIEAVKRISDMAYSKPEEVLKAPTNTVVGKLDEPRAAHPKTICLSWRRYCSLQRGE